MKWLVLSDLHLKFKNCSTSTARKALIEELEKERDKNGKFSFILITGDCMYQHKSDKEKDVSYIKDIATACGTPFENIFICAGNHDVDRNNSERNIEIENIRESGYLSTINKVTEGYGDFHALHQAIAGRFYKHFDTRPIGEFNIITIDSCLLSKDENDMGNLGVCFQELSELEVSKISSKGLNIVIMHHGISWLMPEDSRKFQHWMAKNKVDIIFCGHNHAVGLDVLTEAIADGEDARFGIKQFTCGAGLDDKYAKPSFFIGEYDEDKKLKVSLYTYLENSTWGIGSGLLRSFPNGVHECFFRGEEDNDVLNNYTTNNNDYEVYKTIFDANNDMADDLRKSSFMDFFGMRGGTFLRENSRISDVLYGEKKHVRCRILVSHPYSNTIETRLKMVPEFSPRDKLEKRWKEIYEDIRRLKDNISELDNGEIRFHEQPLTYRFIITDSSLYIGYYEEKNSSQSAMYRYKSTTSLYKSMKSYFENIWAQSSMVYDDRIPDRCSFLLGNFDIMPSLVINLTDECNMHCRYCPTGGENLEKCGNLCDINKIKSLMTHFMTYCKNNKWKDKKVIRITGGEPLIEERRLMAIFTHAKRQQYEKIVLCTNGTLIKDSYKNNEKTWEEVKDILLLKISIDSLKETVFNKITIMKDEEKNLNTIIDNIHFAKNRGFKIELNFVATKDNVGEIESIYDFASRNNLVGVKVLTINDFGERVPTEDVSVELEELISRMRDKGYIEKDLYVHNNKGILMKRFIHNNCMLTIVDHMNSASSITPRRTYSLECQQCQYYPDSINVKQGSNKPCATGIMSLTMRADGMLSFCRLRADKGEFLEGRSSKQIEGIVTEQMENFKCCYHIDSKLS